MKDYKFIVLLFRRVDLWEAMLAFKKRVADCIQGICSKNMNAVIVFTTTLSLPTDDFHVPGQVGMHNNYLSLLTDEATNSEFAKPGKALLCRGRPSEVFYDQMGNLNVASLQLVKQGLENKFRYACRTMKTKSMVFRYTWVYSKEDTMAHTCRPVVTS